ncbi:box C/D snoRNA protein 1 [Sphaeramia orbicularis]|uniref:Box C/D snoRNA protein 1 n=1 Tax=Sphaeramia orbicularis TaxID=375764 RepID=A0A673CCB6_9TELE|nr:box C/D snoRNA protein 1 [Sphaeramia orbicularis]
MLTVESQEESNGQENERKGSKRKISLSNCGVCGSEEAKYRCPGCLKYSCSLLCVKKHKEDSGCSGVRNKTAFVRLSQFDEMALLSDYRFLEDTGRFADGTTRDNLIRTPRTTPKAKRLASNARKMNITLRFLPTTFTKSRENSTFFYAKEKQFMWHLKLIFPQSSTEFSQRRVSDRQTLKQILIPYIHPTESDPVTRQKLKMYANELFDHVKVFMKAEGRKANSVRYHEMDIEKSLRDNLSYKTLIEYPVLHVVLRDHWKDYPLKGQAQPASACSREGEGVKEEEEEEEEVSTSEQTRPDICTGAPEISPELKPPQEKRIKREEDEEEIEEGEIIDSSDEEKDEEHESAELSPSGNKSCDAPVNDMEMKNEEQADNVEPVADDCVNKPSDSSGNQRIIEDTTVSAEVGEAAKDGAEVGVTKEDDLTESEPPRTRHCQDENESASVMTAAGPDDNVHLSR